LETLYTKWVFLWYVMNLSFTPQPPLSQTPYIYTHCFQKSYTLTTDAVYSRIIHKPHDYIKSCNIVQRVQVFTYKTWYVTRSTMILYTTYMLHHRIWIDKISSRRRFILLHDILRQLLADNTNKIIINYNTQHCQQVTRKQIIYTDKFTIRYFSR